jgi:hypothetical protein
MSEHDDIDFDFFGDSAPEPPKKRLVRRPSGPRPGGGSPPPKRPTGHPHTTTPVARLVSLIAFAIAMILILILAVRSCQSPSKSAAYKSYMVNVGKIAKDSATVGQKLSNLLDRQDLKETLIETTLKGLISRQAIDIQQASKLTPPGPLRQQHDQMVEALQLRRSALTGLLAVFKETFPKHGSGESNKAGLALSKKMQRGVASDVIWQDMFVAAARDILNRQGITGVSPPVSVFVADTARASYNTMGDVWQSFHGTQTSNPSGTMLHGTNIDYVKVKPANQTLSGALTNQIKMDSNLRFVVGVRNGGDYLEENIKVTLSIKQNPDPITKVVTIRQIYPGARTNVVFGPPWNLSDPVSKITMTIDVAPVTGETYKANNKAVYEVIFSL